MRSRPDRIAWWAPYGVTLRQNWRALGAFGFLRVWFWTRLFLNCAAATALVVVVFQWLVPAAVIPWGAVAVVPAIGPLVLVAGAIQLVLTPCHVQVRPNWIHIARGQSGVRIRADRVVRQRLRHLPDGRAVLAVRYRDRRERRRSVVLVVSRRVELERLRALLGQLAVSS
ncbi:MAG: hypothetical protein KDA22_07080 [Phycisphaerales bacterium]|nr:hypothetical protein [Phycisphaerales bacterium]